MLPRNPRARATIGLPIAFPLPTPARLPTGVASFLRSHDSPDASSEAPKSGGTVANGSAEVKCSRRRPKSVCVILQRR